MHAIVISFERLHLGYLGCYGNDWIETPHFNRLAAKSVVFDQHFGEDFDSQATNHAWWTGCYQFPRPQLARDSQPDLARLLHTGGVSTRLLVETDDTGDSRVAPAFDEVLAVSGNDGLEVTESAAPFSQLVQQAMRWLEESAEPRKHPSLLWIMSRGVPTPWLPPREFVDLYFPEFGLEEAAHGEETGNNDADDDALDLQQESSAHPPELPADPASEDKGALDLRYARALYAAYVTYLDRWLGKFLAALERHPGRDEVLLIVVAGAGEHLGEHAPLGAETSVLREEVIHVPLVVHLPQSDQAGSRRSALVQSVDLAPTLAEWFGLDPLSITMEGRSLLPLIRGELDAVRDAACMGSDRELALRTLEFLYVRLKPEASSLVAAEPRLFEKPHDRWDLADVLQQYPQRAEELEQQLQILSQR